jgi:hypothetical protein
MRRRNLGAGAVLVGLGAAQRQHQALRHRAEVGEVERHQLRAPQGGGKAHQQQGAVAQAGHYKV